MAKLNMIDTGALRTLRPELDAALQKLGQKYGVSFKTTNGKYSNGPTGSFKLEIAIDDGTGRDAVTLRREQAWREYAGVFDLKPEWLGKTFTYGMSKYKIVGLDSKRRTRPVVIETADGQTKIATAQMVQFAMRAKQ